MPTSMPRALPLWILACALFFGLSAREARAQAPAPDCSACRSYPGLCKTIDTCIKSCKVAPFQAYNCYKNGTINKERCTQLFPECAKTETCDGCSAFPTLCGKLDICLKQCNVAASQAQNCFQSGKIDEAKCKQVYPQCQAADPKCAACRSYPGLCGTIEQCIKSCNVAPFQAQNCAQAGKLDMAKCKQLYPQCQPKK